STKVFAARDAGRVVGTMTLIEDSPLGLPMDELYRDDLARFRDQGRRLTEVSALAIDGEYSDSGVAILARLIRLMILYAVEIGGHDDLCIAVNPRHVRFYRRLYPHFQQLGDIKAYRKVNGAPAVALRIDLRLAHELIPAVRAGNPDVAAGYGFLFRCEGLAKLIAILRGDARRARLTPEQFTRLFNRHHALATATQSQRAFIQSLYPDVDLEALTERGTRQPALDLALAPA